jgi:hypothetical protein
MDISFYSLFFFIITTLLYISSVPVIGKPKLMLVKNSLSEADLGEYYSESMKKMGMFLLIVICTQLALNISYLIDKCQGSAGKNVGAGVILTLIPWLLIFGVMMMIITAFSGLKNVFSDVIGYFAISGSASDLLSQVLISTNINDLIDKEPDPQKQKELTSAAEALMKICGNNSILINQMYPDNFINIWDKMKPLMKEGVYAADAGPEGLKQQILDLVVLRENIGEGLWYIYTAILVSSIVYYNLDTRGCVKDINSIKADYDAYEKGQVEQEKQEELNNSTVYTIS